jgi:hypothetical protein
MISDSSPTETNANTKAAKVCVQCGQSLFRQRPIGKVEQLLFQVFSLSPFWCSVCDQRFYLHTPNSPQPQP